MTARIALLLLRARLLARLRHSDWWERDLALAVAPPSAREPAGFHSKVRAPSKDTYPRYFQRERLLSGCPWLNRDRLGLVQMRSSLPSRHLHLVSRADHLRW